MGQMLSKRSSATQFSKLYDDMASSDCRIEIAGVTIPAHKFPLMTSSPVFHTMFTNPEAEESRTGVVKITQFHHPEPMRAVLRFCYLGTLDNATMDGEWATEIFELADKFRIDDLKALLEKHFIDRTLNVENVVEMAALADSHSAPKLVEACITLIAREGETVFESANWKELVDTRPKLAARLAVEVTRRLQQSRS